MSFGNHFHCVVFRNKTAEIISHLFYILAYYNSDFSQKRGKIVKFEGTKTTAFSNGKLFTIKPINIANGNTITLALYNGKEFVEAKFAKSGGNDITFTTDKTYTSAKVFVWNNSDDITPMCDAETIE